MPLSWPKSWNIPSSVGSCAAANLSVVCDFALYSNGTILSEDQKLAPNNDITGRAIIKAFLASAVVALSLSAALLIDKIKVHLYDNQAKNEARIEHKFYLKLVHAIETLLHALSDQQLVASLALILVLNAQACKVSTYHYNLVCTLLLIGTITHLNALVSIGDFFYKGKLVASGRFVGIIAQFVLTGIVFSARHTKTFPSNPSSLSILPAACFENTNATAGLGFADISAFVQNVTTSSGFNATRTTQFMHSVITSAPVSIGIQQYTSLIAFGIFALVVLLVDGLEVWLGFKNVGMRWTSIFFSALSVVASIGVLCLALPQYNNLRHDMEIPEWYQIDKRDEWTYSAILPILLAGSGSIALVKVLTESLLGIRGRRYERIDKLGAEKGMSDAEGIKNGNGSDQISESDPPA